MENTLENALKYAMTSGEGPQKPKGDFLTPELEDKADQLAAQDEDENPELVTLFQNLCSFANVTPTQGLAILNKQEWDEDVFNLNLNRIRVV